MQRRNSNSFSYLIVGITIFLAILCSIFIYVDSSGNSGHILVQNNNYSFSDILFTNLKVLLIIYLGVISFGVVSGLIIFFNIMNLSLYFMYTSDVYSIFTALKHIIFHGFFELPAFFIAYYVVVDYVYNAVKFRKAFPHENRKRYIFLIFLSFLSLIVAAIIEIIELKYLK